MRNILDETIRKLSDIYDEESKNTFVSFYFNRQEDKHYLERREKTCHALLHGDEQQNFSDTIEEIKAFLKKNTEQNVAIFASKKHGFFHHVGLPMAIHSLFIVDTSPYIRPLARIQDEWESFTLVLLNSNYAKILSVSLGEVEQAKNLSSHIMNKHKKGGWSQARFQRLRKGAIHAFFTEVKEALEKRADEQIILAGPGQAKRQFQDMLPKELRSRIVDAIDISIDDEQELLKESIHRIMQQEEQKSTRAVEHLKEEILKDGLAVYGIDDTLAAARNGQIELLIVEKDYQLKGCICEHCQILRAGPIKDCPICGGPSSEADVIEEIIEFAERTDAGIEFTSSEDISLLGHIGAILRYK